MSRNFFQLPVLLIAAVLIGCSAGTESPVLPRTDAKNVNVSNTHLWGYFDVHIDAESETVTSIQNRTGMFTANVTGFLNSNPLAMTFDILEVIEGADYIDIDINVSINHPFPGLPAYHGYDVRGIFMGEGSGLLSYGDLAYPIEGIDQCMLDDPDWGAGDPGGGGPDGYTRWFNPGEFSEGGMPLFSYTPGKLSTPGYDASANLCPYKYFADGLDMNEDVWDWLMLHDDQDGIFSSGAKNERNYYLRFPTPDPNIVYGYAVIANWEGEGDDYHPSNATEAVAMSVVDHSDVYYVDESNFGGSLKLDMSVFDWGSVISNGVMEDYRLLVDSTVLSNVYEADSGDMTPAGGNDVYSTYSVEIPADAVDGLTGNEFWVIVEYPEYDYDNDFGTENLTGEDPLAAFFRYDLEVSNNEPYVPADPVEGNVELEVIRDTNYAITDVRLTWTGNGNPEYAIYADLNPYDGFDPDTYIAATSGETIDIDSTNYGDFSTNGCYLFTVRARSAAGVVESESTDSEYAFVEMEDFDGGDDPSGGWDFFHRNSDAQFVIEPGPIDDNVIRIGPSPTARWAAVVSPQLPSIDNNEYSVIEVAQRTVQWQTKPWDQQIDGMYSQTTAGYAVGTPNNGDDKFLDFITPPLDAAIDGTWPLEDQLNPTSWLISLYQYFGGDSTRWRGWRIYYLDRAGDPPPIRFSRLWIPEYRDEPVAHGAYGFAIYSHVTPDEVYCDEIAVIIY